MAAIELIREKLASTTPDVRIVALIHARHHGAKASSLAVSVARMLEDEPAVAWHAIRAFMAIGAGAGDATPVLVEQLARATSVPSRMRIIVAIGRIGPPAGAAHEAVLASIDDPELGKYAVETLQVIAADDPRVRAAVCEWIFRTPATADDLLRRSPAILLDEIQARAFARDDSNAISVLAKLAYDAGRRAAVVPRAAELLHPTHPQVETLLNIIRLAPALDDAAFARIATVAREAQSAARQGALAVLGAGRRVELLEPLVVDVIARYREVVPERGEGRNSGYELAAAAEALATCIGGPHHLGGELLDWLRRLPSLVGTQTPTIHFDPIGLIIAATRTLAGPSPQLEAAVAALVDLSMRFIDRDRSRVLRFQAAINQPTADRDKNAGPKASLAEEPDDDLLPPFPPELPPDIPMLEPAVLTSMKYDRGIAAKMVGVSLDDAPLATVEAIDAFLTRARESLAGHEMRLLGILWGEAVRRAVSWKWKQLVGRDYSVLAISSPDGVYAVAVERLIVNQDRNPNLVLTFNMICGGRLPEPNPNRITVM